MRRKIRVERWGAHLGGSHMQAHMGPDDTDAADRRNGRRARTLKGARIIFNAGYSAFECTIRNLSPTGAMLKVGESIGVPNHFELEMEPGQPRKKCTVRWRDGAMIGVSFDET